MLYKDSDEIRQDGIPLDELDDEKIDKAIKGDVENEETPPASPAETTKEEEKATASGQDTDDEKEVPFHKHPRFQEIIHSNSDLKEKLELANKAIEELKTVKKVEDEPIAGWFKELYGENEDAWKIYNTQSKRDREETKREILAELENKSKSQEQESVKWNNWVDNEVIKLAEDGHKFDRNKLMKIMVDYKPTDETGNLDFNKGIDLYEKLYKEEPIDKDKSNIKKKIADTTTSAGKSIQDKPAFLTAKQLRYKSFTTLAEDSE